MTLLAIQRAYTKAELRAVPVDEIVAHYATWSKSFVFPDGDHKSRFLSLELALMCDAAQKGDTMRVIAGQVRRLTDEIARAWRGLVHTTIGFRVSGVDHVIRWHDSPRRWTTDQPVAVIEAQDAAERSFQATHACGPEDLAWFDA